MRIASVKPFDGSLVPGISITLAHEFEENVVSFVMSGYLASADGKILTQLLPLPELPGDGERRELLWQFAPESISGQRPRRRKEIQRSFLCALDHHAVDHIETLRMSDPKRDVHLVLAVALDFSVLNASVGDFKQGQQIEPNIFPVLSSYGRGDRSNANLRILVTQSDTLLQSHQLTAKLGHTVKSSDWIHDLAPVLGLGRVLVVEVPEPGSIIPNGSNLDAESKEFMERLQRAGSIMSHMNKDLLAGEWADVVRKSREFWELFQEGSKQLDVRGFVKKLISGATGIDDDKSANVIQGIGRFYGYASDLLHPIGNSGVKDVFVGGKEDAYLAYSLTAGFLNLATRKFKLYSGGSANG